MTIPKKLDILGVEYQIKQIRCVSRFDARKGEIDYLTHTVTIDEELPEDAKEETLLHEVIHAILERLGLDDNENNEQVVSGLAAVLHATLRPFGYSSKGAKNGVR